MPVTVSNAHYVNDQGGFDVIADWGDGPQPYTVNPDDPALIAVAIREKVAAENIPIAAYVAPEPIEAPAVPIVVAASSAKLVLDDDGIYAAVETVCKAHPVNAVRIFWESANTWAEDNAYVQAIGVELGLTEETMHTMFVRAQSK